MKTMLQTAVLLFVRSGSEEIREKGMYQSKAAVGRDFFGGLNRHIVNEVSKTKFPVFVFNSDKQVGNSFAERIKNAFEELFNQGFERVISVGNDVPLLSSEHIVHLINQLNVSEVAFGKTQYGGVYGLALSRKGFSSLDFSSLDWQTDHLVASIIDQSNQLTISFSENAEVLAELNSEEDVQIFIQQLQKDQRKLVSWMIALFQRAGRKKVSSQEFYADPSATSFHFRGPPACFV